MAGKPGAVLDDDDLIVEVEQSGPGFTPPAEPEEIEDAPQAALSAPTVPPDEDDEATEEPARAPVKGKDDGSEDIGYDEAFQRAAEAEESVRQIKADAILYKAQADAEKADSQINTVKVGINTLTEKLEIAYGYLAQAEEAGDNAAKRAAERDIRKMEQLKGEFETTLSQLPNPQVVYDQGRQRAHAVATAVPRGKKIGNGIEARHPLAERWAGSNGWMKTNGSANKFVIAQSARMTEEGFDPNSPGFYAELGRRVQLSYPNLKVQNLQAQKRGPGQSQMRSPVAPGRSANGSGVTRQANGKTRYTITASEQKRMIAHKLDPANKVHQKAWARQRMQSAQREQM